LVSRYPWNCSVDKFHGAYDAARAWIRLVLSMLPGSRFFNAPHSLQFGVEVELVIAVSRGRGVSAARPSHHASNAGAHRWRHVVHVTTWALHGHTAFRNRGQLGSAARGAGLRCYIAAVVGEPTPTRSSCPPDLHEHGFENQLQLSQLAARIHTAPQPLLPNAANVCSLGCTSTTAIR
jgi:hypothetical protein